MTSDSPPPAPEAPGDRGAPGAAGTSTASKVLTAVVFAVVACGLVVTVLWSWRGGLVAVAAGLILGGGLRLGMPSQAGGALVVRSRIVDASVLLALGAGMLVLATSIPAPE